MKLTTGQLKDMYPALKKFYNCDELPVKFALMLARKQDEIEKEIKHIDEQHQKLVKKYGEHYVDENGEPGIRVTKENMDIFIKQYDELMDIELDIDLPQITINDLPENLRFSPNEIKSIYGIILIEDGNW